MKTIALFIPLFFSYLLHSQPPLGYGKEIEISDSTYTIVVAFDTFATASGFFTPNGFAGSVWFEIAGDTARYGRKNFDWRDGTTNITCSIPGLACGTSYTIKLVARTRAGITKTTVKHFSTTKCAPKAEKSEKKKRKRKN